MALTAKEVEDLALKARLKITDAEKEFFAEQLSSILKYVDKLDELDTSEVEPLIYILPVSNRFRADEIRSSASRDEILANGPLVEDFHFKVPKII
ncbi:MAG TPA: Asp-tRNA(Asn)/Glu-tRNA(Gln) amidotransferase subunit GatC [Syntrophomonadaceae bacterium]|nr:Asp-tRNA(Asn)/Glu-tRNA(Gln) amidotransferase subunit GatC [Syntrophomonadaceae bacterium]